ESVTNTRKELERDFENGTESLNGKESATPLARLEMLDCISLTEKLSRAFLIDSTNREVESKKGHVSAKFSVMLCARPTTSDSVAEMSSESPLNPVKSLLAASERAGVSERNFPADLLMLSVMPARLSEMLLNPVKTLATASESAGVSETARNPVKTLFTTSDIAGDSANPLILAESS